MPTLNFSYNGNDYQAEFDKQEALPYPYYCVTINDENLILSLNGHRVFYFMETGFNRLQIPSCSLSEFSFFVQITDALFTWMINNTNI